MNLYKITTVTNFGGRKVTTVKADSKLEATLKAYNKLSDEEHIATVEEVL